MSTNQKHNGCLLECDLIHFSDERKVLYFLPTFVKISIKDKTNNLIWLSIQDLFKNKSNIDLTAECFEGKPLKVKFLNKIDKQTIPWISIQEQFVIGNFLFKM